MKGVAKAIYAQGQFTSVEGTTAVYSVENAPTRDRAERARADVENLLGAHFGHPVTLRIEEGSGAPPTRSGSSASSAPRREQSADGRPPPTDDRGPGSDRPRRTPIESAESPTNGSQAEAPHDDDYFSIDVTELEDADVAQSGLERLLEAFPGAKVIHPDPEAR